MEETKIIGEFETPTEEELAEINKYTRRKFSADEVYAFSVVLCDNEVDRDYERFTDSALERMAELFKGVTGIFDHSHKSENQCARIFTCRAETVEGKQNSLGEPYCRLFARAYMPRSAKASELILDIEAGIKKEVSVGCSMAASRCSVCGQSAGLCNHHKGKHYRVDGKRKLCFFELSDPKDAYEWSFVAVPAQPAAGVVKNFSEHGKFLFGDLVKNSEKGRVVLTESEARNLSEQVEELMGIARDAGEFLKNQKTALIKSLVPSGSDKICELLGAALDRLDPAELFKLKSELDRKDDAALPQLAISKRTSTLKTNDNNNTFKI